MSKFGIQYPGESLETFLKQNSCIDNTLEDSKDIRDILRRFRQGYSERNLENVDSFTEELFINSDDISVLGTSTGEILLGFHEVKQLIRGDWEYWGDLNIDCENPHISIDNNVAWFSTKGSVKYNFEHTPERYDRYVDYIKTNAEDNELTPKQRITFINWVLTLNYHQRDEQSREYFWPMGLSGMLLKEENSWKIAHLQFSMAKSNFPDERFENSKDYMDSYNEQRSISKKYKNNKATEDIIEFLKSFQEDFREKKNISDILIRKYFNENNNPYVIGPENKWYEGVEHIKKFFIDSDMDNLYLDIENTIACKLGDITWITTIGTLKHKFTEEELINRSLQELDNLFKSNLSSKEKLFAAQRSVAYVLKECATGVNYTCPIRMTAIISNHVNSPKFNYIHFSFPFYWIFEGKIDGILQ
ncbi:nuclear transport factor 2 family protein [Clostridium hydrogeniformans]|uniref:nuclear transport factor 2 family protein n=1 Tax=Clostridium hydrogeniformans TaxID=349933 RepID=UPI00047FD624|nr:nuclear transport factor 2 family protein [Clostridium hydrogeniformans]